MRLSETTTKICIKIGHTISGKNVANDSTFWRYKVYAEIRGSSLGSGEGRQTTVGLSRTAIFSVLLAISSERYYMAIYSPSAAFHTQNA